MITSKITDEGLAEEANFITSNISSQTMKSPDSKQLMIELRNLFKEEFTNNQELYLRQDYDNIMDTKNDWHCVRYLNHFFFDLDKAFSNMKDTLRWRKEREIDEINDSCFPKELWLYGPIFSCGKGRDGCIMLYLMGRQYRPLPEVIRPIMRDFFCYTIERLERDYPNGEKAYIVFDQTDSSLLNVDIASIRWLVSVKDNWPDRVKAIFIVGLPFILRPIYRMVIAWLPKQWRNTVKVGTLEELIDENVDIEQLPWFLGGSIDATCRLAPRESKWAADMDFFKDTSILEKFYTTVCNHVTDEEKEYFEEIQAEHDKQELKDEQISIH